MNNYQQSEVVKRARSANKITGMEIIQNVFPDFVELHGDRAGGDDPAIVGGISYFPSANSYRHYN